MQSPCRGEGRGWREKAEDPRKAGTPGRGELGRRPAPEKAPRGARRGVRRAAASRSDAAPSLSPSSPPPPPPKATETTAREEGKVTPGTSAGISPGAVMTPSRGAIKPRSLRSGVPAAAALSV